MKSLVSLPRLTAVAALAIGVCGAAFADDVTVTLTGVKAGGQILGALQTEAEFMKPSGTYGAMAPSKDGAVTLIFKDVKPGEYSLSVLQDDDDNKTMTLDAKGMPAEGWAMKNGASIKGKPTFAKAKFTVEAKPMAFSEPMIYPKK
jgi:uncharacterized protein (DUF2141 family)